MDKSLPWGIQVITGAEAAAYAAALCRVQVIAAYPITPQSSIAEKLAELCEQGVLDAEYIPVESEFSSMAVCYGASANGARAFTATSSQGLLYMDEMLHWVTGSRLPVVMVNVNRAIGGPWNLWSDHLDSMSKRDTGWVQLYCENAQEVLDATIQAFKIAEKLNVPVMVCEEGFLISHTSEKVDVPSQELVDAYLKSCRRRKIIDVDNPQTFNAPFSPRDYAKWRLETHKQVVKAIQAAKQENRVFGRNFGRRYGNGVIEYTGPKNPDKILILCGSMADVAKEVTQKRNDVGLIKIRMLHPFPTEDIKSLINKKRPRIIGVVDRDLALGTGGILFQLVKSALYESNLKPPVAQFLAGIGGSDVPCDVFNQIIKDLDKETFSNELKLILPDR